MCREELWNKFSNGEMSIDEFDKAMKNLRIEEWKVEVLNEAKEVKEAYERGENKWARRVADMMNAEVMAKSCGADVEELKEFVRKAYAL